jgi:hypothetical protein
MTAPNRRRCKRSSRPAADASRSLTAGAPSSQSVQKWPHIIDCLECHAQRGVAEHEEAGAEYGQERPGESGGDIARKCETGERARSDGRIDDEIEGAEARPQLGSASRTISSRTASSIGGRPEARPEERRPRAATSSTWTPSRLRANGLEAKLRRTQLFGL